MTIRKKTPVVISAAVGVAALALGIQALEGRSVSTDSLSIDQKIVAAAAEPTTTAESNGPTFKEMPAAAEAALRRQGYVVNERLNGAELGQQMRNAYANDPQQPSEVYVARVTTPNMGRVVDRGGKPISDPRGGPGERVDPSLNSVRVFIGVYPDQTIPFGGSYVTGYDANGVPQTSDSPEP